MLEDRERLAREAVRKAKKNAPGLFSKEGSRQFYRAHMERADIEILVALAREGDKDALEILRTYARGARHASMTVPADLHEFVWEWFIDGPPKAKSGTNPKDRPEGLDHRAARCEQGEPGLAFPEYRNSEHRGNPDAPTASLAGRRRTGAGERTVEEIWLTKAMVTRRRRPQ